MNKDNIYSVVTLSFCAMATDFLTFSANEFFYPRDRIIHILISAVLAYFLAYAVNKINFEKNIFKISALVFTVFRIRYILSDFLKYFSTFHGSNSFAIIILSVFLAVMVFNFTDDKEKQIYNFFIFFNAVLILLAVSLSVPKINVINIYSGSLKFDFSFDKLCIFWDIAAICVLIKDEKEKIYAQKRYIVYTAVYFVFITILQGLCVNGNLLYSISPLQSLMLVFNTATIKRFDYIISMFQTVNYFGAVILYTWVFKKLCPKRGLKNA